MVCFGYSEKFFVQKSVISFNASVKYLTQRNLAVFSSTFSSKLSGTAAEGKCMHRTKFKMITPEAELLKRLRESRNLSMRDAAEIAGKSIAWISHVENGRMNLTEDHLKILIPAYGQTSKSFQAYLNGNAYVDSPARKECLDTIHDLPDQHIEALLPLVQTLKTSKPKNAGGKS